jgi:hypothetical protein
LDAIIRNEVVLGVFLLIQQGIPKTTPKMAKLLINHEVLIKNASQKTERLFKHLRKEYVLLYSRKNEDICILAQKCTLDEEHMADLITHLEDIFMIYSSNFKEFDHRWDPHQLRIGLITEKEEKNEPKRT